MRLLEQLFVMDTSWTKLRFRPQGLSAPAWLATVGLEAAETMYLHHSVAVRADLAAAWELAKHL